VPESISPIVESRVVEPVKHPLPETAEHGIAASAVPRLLELAAPCDAVAIGPGIGTSDETRRLLLELLPGLDKPVVVDADGLNLLAGNLEVLRRIRPPVILTPHPGEFSRLTGLAAVSINADRIGVSRSFATENGVVLVLKGASTVIAGRDGRVFVNPTGNSGLASGGTGDVLTGLLAGLLAQGMKPFDAAGAAAYIHGMAADIAADDVTEYCLSASDVLDYLPDAFDRLLHPGHDQP
jgi:NAD(P)H-hydrate epimerase